jgi:hypothetical protein
LISASEPSQYPPPRPLPDPDPATEREFGLLSAASSDLPDARPFPGGPLRVERRQGIVFSAPHQAAHIRDGVTLPSEFGSAELAFALARNVDGSAVCTAEGLDGDPNWDPGHPYLDVVRDLAGGAPVIDLHKMRPRGVDICVGLGSKLKTSEHLWMPIVTEAVSAGLRVAVNWPFAAGPVTITSQLQNRGLDAVQIELSFDCYDEGPTKVAAWTSLLRAVRAILKGLAPRSSASVIRRPQALAGYRFPCSGRGWRPAVAPGRRSSRSLEVLAGVGAVPGVQLAGTAPQAGRRPRAGARRGGLAGGAHRHPDASDRIRRAGSARIPRSQAATVSSTAGQPR